MSTLIKNILIFVAVFVALSLGLSALNRTEKKPEPIGLQKFIEEIQNGEMAKIEIVENELRLTLKDKRLQTLKKESTEPLSQIFKNYNVDLAKVKEIDISVKEDRGFGFWFAAILPFIFPIVLFGLLIFFMARQVQGVNSRMMGFGQAAGRETPKDSKDKTTFKDVAGLHEAKEELQEVVEFLKDTKKFAVMGAKIPKGVLLMGSPGTGKTMLARAVAGEANVPLFHMSGSEFVEMFVGVGSARVRALFDRAKKAAPAIVFIDEIDAVGRRRGSGIGGSHDEREQTLNQILVEMDGFDPHLGVIVIAATNRPDVLDPALLRPGRFDRRVILDEPDIKDREEILQVHARGKPLGAKVSLRQVAERTPGFSGADLANLLNEAAILAVRRGQAEIGMSEILESVEKVMLGPERRSRVISEAERKLTAYHEAGHALVAHSLPHTDPVRKVSIIARGRAGGYTLKMAEEDKRSRSRLEFEEDLAVMLGGFAAENEIFGAKNLSTGPADDLRQATKLARRVVTEFGMSDKLGPRTFGEREDLTYLGQPVGERDYSDKTAEVIDEEMRHLVDQAKQTATTIIKEKREQLETLARELLAKETLDQGEFVALLGSKAA